MELINTVSGQFNESFRWLNSYSADVIFGEMCRSA